MHTILPFLWVAAGVVLATIADVFLKKSGLTHPFYLTVGIGLYALGAFPIAVAFKLIDFSIVFFAWEGIAILLGLALGVLVFQEHLSGLKIAAFGAASLALVLSYLAAR
jgi:multidrug transporter EmrE-like cation transporter